MRRSLTTLLATAALSAATLLPMQPALALDDAEKAEMGAFIREYLIANPEIMLEVQQALQAKQAAAQQEQANAVIEQNHETIFNADYDLSVGNPDGAITVVEFFDYNCGYCKRAHEDMKAIVAANDDVRFILKEFPILGPESLAAHRVSMALKQVAPEKYAEFQNALISAHSADEATAIALASELGVSEEDLRAKMDNAVVQTQIQETYALADALGISGTPSYIVGDEAVFGAVGAEALNEKIGNLRDCGSATC